MDKKWSVQITPLILTNIFIFVSKTINIFVQNSTQNQIYVTQLFRDHTIDNNFY